MGWYLLDSDGTLAEAPFDFGNTAINSDITLRAVWKLPPVSYVSAGGEAQDPVDEYTEVFSETSQWEETVNGGWYAINADAVIEERVAVTGDVNLILLDGCTLTSRKGIRVPAGSSLTIWGQVNGTGRVEASGDEGNAGIGGNRHDNTGSITINGGKIDAAGGTFINEHDLTIDYEGGAGIGGGAGNDGGTITINGGAVTSVGGRDAAGIGGGWHGDGGTITISGGTVTARSNNTGAGIGTGYLCDDAGTSTINISGGTVTATCGESGAGIGGGAPGTSTGDGTVIEINISGGSISATGGISDFSAGIGGYGADSVTTTLGYTDDTMRGISIYANSYSGTVKLEKAFRDMEGTPFAATEGANVADIGGRTLIPGGIFVVRIDDVQYGTVTADRNAAFQGESVTLTVTPEDGGKVDSLTCTYSSGEEGETTVPVSAGENGKYSFTMPAADVTVSAKFKAKIKNVPYVEADGTAQYHDAFVLQGYETTLDEEWYVAKAGVPLVYDALTLEEDVRLILADGAEMSVVKLTSADEAMTGADYDLTIYGQENQSGTLNNLGENDQNTLAVKKLGVYGGIINSNSQISAFETVTIGAGSLNAVTLAGWKGVAVSGGKVTVSSNLAAIENDVNIIGGIVEACGDDSVGITAFDGDIILGWTSAGDSIKAADYTVVQNGHVVKVVEGKVLAAEDSDAIYSGTLTSDKLGEIRGKKLVPRCIVTFDSDGGSAVDAQAVIPGQKAGKPTDPTREGYTFKDWYQVTDAGTLAETAFDFDAAITEDITLKAKWEKPLAFDSPKFVLPDDTVTIEDNAFEGAAMESVFIPDACTAIGREAFKDCENLIQIRIPANCAIGEEVFDGCEKVYIYGTVGSEAQTYCQSHTNCIFVAEEQN